MSKSGMLQHEEARDGRRRPACFSPSPPAAVRAAPRPPPARPEAAARQAGASTRSPWSPTRQPGTTFWDRIRAGAEQAAKQHGIDLKYSNDPDAGKQATLIQNAIDSKVDAIAATLANPDAVGPALQKATDAGIPDVGLQLRHRHSTSKYGALMYFGSDESLAGQSAGAAARQGVGGRQGPVRGARRRRDSSLETRCAGVKQAFPNTENLQVNGSDLPSVHPTIQAKLAQDPSITDIVTLDAGIAGAAIQAKSAAGSQAKIVTFDLNQDVVQAIKDKKIEFSVDQQPYLQAYLAVDSLWLYLTNGNVHRWR